MKRSSEAMDIRASTFKKRRFHPDDRFFEDGNLLCRLVQEKYLPPESLCDNQGRDDMEVDRYSISCQMHGCAQLFGTLASYEDHYATRHRNVCQTCGKVFPTLHLLEIHLNEQHNPMFEILAKSTNMYVCLVSGCDEKFDHSKRRKKHLVEIHKYPSSFRFDRIANFKCKKTVERCKQHEDTDMDTASLYTCEVKDHKQETVVPSRFQYSYKVPKSISFGSGVQRGFTHSKNKPRPRGNHLTKKKASHAEAQINIEDIDMNELAQSLDS